MLLNANGVYKVKMEVKYTLGFISINMLFTNDLRSYLHFETPMSLKDGEVKHPTSR